MKRLSILAALAFAFLMVAGTRSNAQPYTCIIVNGVKCYVIPHDDGTEELDCDPGTTGSGTFISQTGPIPAQGPVNAVLTPDNINATTNDPTRGIITTTLDRSQPSPQTTITSNDPAGGRFPLSVDIQFPSEATVSSQPGVTYKSRTPLQFHTDNARSVDPFENEVLTLVNDVQFYDANDPNQATAFTLQAGSTSVTLGGSGGGGDVPGEVH